MDIKDKELGLLLSTEPNIQQMKNAVFLLQILKLQLFFLIIVHPQPLEIEFLPPPLLTKVVVAPRIGRLLGEVIYSLRY